VRVLNRTGGFTIQCATTPSTFISLRHQVDSRTLSPEESLRCFTISFMCSLFSMFPYACYQHGGQSLGTRCYNPVPPETPSYRRDSYRFRWRWMRAFYCLTSRGAYIASTFSKWNRFRSAIQCDYLPEGTTYTNVGHQFTGHPTLPATYLA
jgi:hypothetical protein